MRRDTSILEDVAMLAVPSNRTKFYIHQMAQHRVLPSHVLYMEDPSATTPEERAIAQLDEAQERDQPEAFSVDVSVPASLAMHGITFQRLPSIDPNSELVVEAVASCKQPIMIYSGPGGAILRRRLLATGKRFLHVHSGILPDFRGSTTAYYSLLKDQRCGATAFFLDRQIDTGPVIRSKTYPPPKDRTTIDLYYDPLIRAELLAEVLVEYARTGSMPTEPQESTTGETYYIIHPVLKHIAILATD